MDMSQPTADVVLAAIRLNAGISIAIGLLLLVAAVIAAVWGRRAFLRGVAVAVKPESTATDESMFMATMAKAVGAAIVVAILLAGALSHLASSSNWIAITSPHSALITQGLAKR